MFLNENYNELKKQLDNIIKYVKKSTDSLEVYDYINFYEGLLYTLKLDYPPYNLRFFFTKQQKILRKETKRKYQFLKNNLKENYDYHQDFLMKGIDEIISIKNEVIEKFPSISDEAFPILEEQTCLDLLNSFLKEEDQTLKNIFEDMLKHQRIYVDNQSRNAYCLYHNF